MCVPQLKSALLLPLLFVLLLLLRWLRLLLLLFVLLLLLLLHRTDQIGVVARRAGATLLPCVRYTPRTTATKHLRYRLRY